MRTNSALRAVTVGIAGVAAVAALAGCGGHSGSSAKVDATSSAVQAGEKDANTYLKSCIPSSGIGQVELGRKLLTKGGRKSFSECLAIPKANRTAFEGALLTAAEKVKWSDSAQRDAFFTGTLPALAEKYRAPAAK